MAKADAVRAKARAQYVTGRLSLTVIAGQVGVSRKTLSRWKAAAAEAGDDWDLARSASAMAGQSRERMSAEAVEGFATQYQMTIKALEDDKKMPAAERVKMLASLADAYNKTMSAAGRAAPKLSKLAVATDILGGMADFVRAEFPQHAHAFEEVLEPFAQHLVAELAE